MTPFFAERNKVVVCSSRADEQFLMPLLVRLRPLTQQVLLDLWDERRTASPAWQDGLKLALRSAKIVFLLTSPDFFGSPLMRNPELPLLLDDARRGSALVFLVILKPGVFEQTTLARFPVLNAAFKPVMALSLAEEDQLWERVVDLVQDTFNLPRTGADVGFLPSLPSAAPDETVSSTMRSSAGPSHPFGEQDPSQVSWPEVPGAAGSFDDGLDATVVKRPGSQRSLDTSWASRVTAPRASDSGGPADPGGAAPLWPAQPSPPGSASEAPGWANYPGSQPMRDAALPRSQEQSAPLWPASEALPPPARQEGLFERSAAGGAAPSVFAPPAASGTPMEASVARQEPVESLRFTAFYPKEVAVETWNTLLVYTHIAAALSQVQADAARFKQEIGERQREAFGVASRPMKRGTELTIVPQGQGVVFNPARMTFAWLEDWHQAAFRFQAKRELAGLAMNAEITVYAGPLILAVLRMPLLCEGRLAGEALRTPDAQATALAYQHIFTSYSHRDTEVVLACRNAYQSLGLDVLIDVDSLRAGEDFNRALMQMIETSDIFQLFWSRRSAESPYVRKEWEYALAHSKGEGFIRPVYWELPQIPPPEPLGKYHFKYIELPKLASSVDVYAPPAIEKPRELVCFRCETVNQPESKLCSMCSYDLSGQRGQDDHFLDPAGRPYYARFSVMSGPMVGRRFTLHQDATTIGRIIENDVVIPELTVSRNHAVLRFVEDHWLVEDKDSHNGTFVNGTRIGWPQALKDGDQLRFGDAVVVFQVIS